MKMRSWLFIVVIIFTVLSISCAHEKTAPPGVTIYGSWVRLITDSKKLQFHAELKIITDNSFDFILLEPAPGHTNSSGKITLQGNVLTVINDADCGVDGVYEFVVSENKLAFLAVADECAPRRLAMQGVWSRK